MPLSLSLRGDLIFFSFGLACIMSSKIFLIYFHLLKIVCYYIIVYYFGNVDFFLNLGLISAKKYFSPYNIETKQKIVILVYFFNQNLTIFFAFIL